MPTEEESARRGGMLQRVEQLEERTPPGSNDARSAFVLGFLRQLIRQSSGDSVYLAAVFAGDKVGFTQEESMALATELSRDAGSYWPEGFM